MSTTGSAFSAGGVRFGASARSGGTARSGSAAPTTPADDALIERESITIAFPVLLESLTPSERAAFILRDVFDYDYAEIAGIVRATEATTRQLVHRARKHVRERKPRFEADRRDRDRTVDEFLRAVETGDLSGMESVLAEDVVLTADGGGKAPSAPRPIHGSGAVGPFLAGIWIKAAATLSPERWAVERTEINGEAAIVSTIDDRIDTILVFGIDRGRIARIYSLRNPDKLRGFALRR